jgi:hypothetical protein
MNIRCLHEPKLVNARVKKKTKTKDLCIGGYCNLNKVSKLHGTFLSEGEGLSPPLKEKNTQEEVYQLSYPDDVKIKPIVVGPMYLLWMGHRWYSSP